MGALDPAKCDGLKGSCSGCKDRRGVSRKEVVRADLHDGLVLATLSLHSTIEAYL